MLIFVVLCVFEKFYNIVQHKVYEEGVLYCCIFDCVEFVVVCFSEVCDWGGVGLLLRFEYVVLEWLVYCKIWVAFGGWVVWLVSGGVFFGFWFGYFFCGVGVMVFEGYGFIEIIIGGIFNFFGW